MRKTRTQLAVIAMVASMSVLAACSENEDANAPGSDAGTESPATTPAPAPAPAPTPAPETTPAPSTTPAPDGGSTGGTAPATQSPTAGEVLKESAKQTAVALANKADELKDRATAKASEVGANIREGAARVDATIQESVSAGNADTAQDSQKL